MNSLIESGVSIALAIVGLAIIAVLVSRNSNAPALIQSLSSGLANNIGVASAPVSGAKLNFSLNYPSDTNYGFGN